MLCKLSDKDLALLAIKALKEKGAENITETHVKAFVRIVKKYCEEVEK
ncbi:MAG: hypothetical protein JHC33_05770 [Ignisphaera sp.]|nr:hypothetical protein [Ignisphaera sp.]